MVDVAAFAAGAPALLLTTMTSTCRETNSTASAGSRPSAETFVADFETVGA
jgi:hypothetical protein